MKATVLDDKPIEELDEDVATDEELDEDSPLQSGEQPEPPEDHGKPKRKRGRPPGTGKTGAFISELPTAPQFQFTSPDKFFAYVRSIPKEKGHRFTMAFYRYMPVCDVTNGGQNAKSIAVIGGDDPNFPFRAEDWETAILQSFGSGNYGCYLNEMNKTVCRCLKINTRWVPDEYPPAVDPATLDEHHIANKSYITWLRGRGTKLPSDLQTDEERSTMQVTEKLVDSLLEQQRRMNTPVPVMPPRESAADKLTLEGATAVIGMVKQQAQSMTNAATPDPLAMIRAFTEVASSNSKPLELMMAMHAQTAQQERERAARAEERNNQLMQQLLQMHSTPPPSQPSMIDRLREMKELKELLSDNEPSAPARGGGWKDMLLEALPTIVPMALQVVDRFATAATTVAAVRNGQTPPPAPPPVQPPAQPQTALPNGMKAEEVQQYLAMLNHIAGPLTEHFKAEQSGYAFADWFIEGYGKIPAYVTIANRCRTADGTVDVTPLLEIIKLHPGIWGIASSDEARFRQFLHEFVTVDDAPREDDDDEDEGRNEDDAIDIA